jgi:hypothetical protein
MKSMNGLKWCNRVVGTASDGKEAEPRDSMCIGALVVGPDTRRSSLLPNLDLDPRRAPSNIHNSNGSTSNLAARIRPPSLPSPPSMDRICPSAISGYQHVYI